MSQLIEQALRNLESSDFDTVNEGFLTLGEVVAVNRCGGFHSDVVPEANNEILEWGHLEDIQHAVQLWISNHSDHPSVVSAFHVLGKFGDKALRPFFRHWLDEYVQRILPNIPALGTNIGRIKCAGRTCYFRELIFGN